MIFFSLQEILLMLIAALVIDLLVGDPRWITHPVTVIGKLIRWFEQWLMSTVSGSPAFQRIKGMSLLVFVTGSSFFFIWILLSISRDIHLWLCYALNVWFISTTIACRGLKDAATDVIIPLQNNDIDEARRAVSMIVGRDTNHLEEPEIVRATVETVAENTVDAFISPLFYAFIGAAPLAMLYRAVNTLDSMVGYKNKRYLYFGWASARTDDVLNFIPARLTGFLLVIVALFLYGTSSSVRSVKAIFQHASLHPSPNSGIPESAVAGALHIQLGGTNKYGDVMSHRAYMGWPGHLLCTDHIYQTVRMLYMSSYFVAGGIVCLLCWQLFNF
jgi:adenosylcobinamide-phosphate synthase